MKRTLLWGAALVGAAFAVAAPAANFVPYGSYQRSCTNISVSGDSLSASCTTLSGSQLKTTLVELGQCMNSITHYGDIANLDGSLVCMPDLPKVVAGFEFPRAESEINGWVYGQDDTAMYRHGWGIWAGLTHYVGTVGGAELRAFETWDTPSNMLYAIGQASSGKAKMLGSEVRKAQGLRLQLPHQFRNTAKAKGDLKLLLKEWQSAKAATSADTNIFVSVAYNPPASSHAVSNKLFYASTLKNYIKEGYKEIPNFPANAITIKPVYKVITQSKVVDGIYTFPGWPGTPDPARAFPESDWANCVYVAVKGTGKGGNSIDPTCANPNASNTFYLNNFIHQTISKDDAAYLNSQFGLTAKAGDIAILVGMHVTTREIKRWAWQTFWWSADANSPKLPSSDAIAKLRPKELDEAAGHYAMSLAYQMVSPAQPINGGVSEGESVIAYNPHLEAGFDPGVFQILKAVTKSPSAVQMNQYGVQTNCMTCHNLALYSPSTDYQANNGANRERPYGTDYYMSLDDTTFDGVLRLDFAWSILGSLDTDK